MQNSGLYTEFCFFDYSKKEIHPHGTDENAQPRFDSAKY